MRRTHPSSASAQSRTDTTERLTAELLTLLDQVTPEDFVLPWNRSDVRALRPLNPLTGTRYRGINWLMLSCLSGLTGGLREEDRSFTSARFATYRQWSEAGYQVRGGSRGVHLIFFKQLTSQSAASNEEPGDTAGEAKPGRGRRVLRGFTVFAAEQVEGAEGFLPDALPGTCHGFDAVDFIRRLGVHIEYGSQRAASIRDLGYILMPLRESFTSDETYLATLFHELVHWTNSKVARQAWINEHFAGVEERYAFEELVAEIGSTMLAGVYGIQPSAQRSNAAYLKSWLQALRNDQSYIFRAAAKAQEAVDWIISAVGSDFAGDAADEHAEPEEALSH
jgi:antirestriction protein ArdC